MATNVYTHWLPGRKPNPFDKADHEQKEKQKRRKEKEERRKEKEERAREKRGPAHFQSNLELIEELALIKALEPSKSRPCQHGRQKSCCKDCGTGTGQHCQHQRQKSAAARTAARATASTGA
jgi:hypothetical protein